MIRDCNGLSIFLQYLSFENYNYCFICSLRRNPNEYTEVRVGDIDTFKARNFQNNKPVKFLVHGFNHNATEGPGSFPNDAKDGLIPDSLIAILSFHNFITFVIFFVQHTWRRQTTM
jgi:hypothetical protein